MANLVRARVELKNYNPHASYDERWQDFRFLLGKFRKQCADAGIQNSYKEHSAYESESRKKRRKKHESELQQLKARLKENFTERGRPYE